MDKRKAMVLAGALWVASTGCQAARADEVMDWNAVAAAALSSAPAPKAAQVMASTHIAMHDAINSIEPRYRPHGFSVPVHMRASLDAAAASAAHDVLVAMVPQERAEFDAALARSLSKVAEGRAKRDGVGAGRAVAQAVITWRAADAIHSRVSPPAPFVMKSATQFSPAGCPALRGAREVPAWNAVARTASNAKDLSMHDNARLFALLYMAEADASMAGPSERCVVSGAAEKVLRVFFDSDSMKLDYVRSAMARPAEDASIMLGRKIGSYAVANFLGPVQP